MFVRIENHKDPSEYQLIDIANIGSVIVTSVSNELLVDTDTGKVINYDIIINHTKMMHDMFPNTKHFDCSYSDANIRNLLDEAKLSDSDKDRFWKLFKEYKRILRMYANWLDGRQTIHLLASHDDPSHTYRVYLKGASQPIYTTKSTVDTLNKVLCNTGVDINVCNDNRQATPTCE